MLIGIRRKILLIFWEKLQIIKHEISWEKNNRGGGGGHFCENFDALILDALGCLFKITIFKFDRKATQCK